MLSKCIFALSAISMAGCLATHKPNKNIRGMFENPQRPQKETQASKLLGAYTVDGQIAWVQGVSSVLMSKRSAISRRSTLVSIPGTHSFAVISGRDIFMESVSQKAPRRIGQLPVSATNHTASGETPRLGRAFISSEKKLCLKMEVGNQNIPNENGDIQYATWHYQVDLNDGRVVEIPCSKRSEKTVEQQMGFELMTDAKKCGVRLGEVFFPMAFSQRADQGCQLRTQRPCPPVDTSPSMPTSAVTNPCR